MFVIAVGLLTSGIQIDAAQKLSLRVSPSVVNAPGYVMVTVTVQRDPDNRALEISADSGGFYRSSEIQLEGERAPLITQVALNNLPGGEYEIVATLSDRRGRHTVARSSALIMSALGPERPPD
jgi:hypothetical protein